MLQLIEFVKLHMAKSVPGLMLCQKKKKKFLPNNKYQLLGFRSCHLNTFSSCPGREEKARRNQGWRAIFISTYCDLGRYIHYYATLKKAWDDLEQYLGQWCPRMIGSLKGTLALLGVGWLTQPYLLLSLMLLSWKVCALISRVLKVR